MRILVFGDDVVLLVEAATRLAQAHHDVVALCPADHEAATDALYEAGVDVVAGTPSDAGALLRALAHRGGRERVLVVENTTQLEDAPLAVDFELLGARRPERVVWATSAAVADTRALPLTVQIGRLVRARRARLAALRTADVARTLCVVGLAPVVGAPGLSGDTERSALSAMAQGAPDATWPLLDAATAATRLTTLVTAPEPPADEPGGLHFAGTGVSAAELARALGQSRLSRLLSRGPDASARESYGDWAAYLHTLDDARAKARLGGTPQHPLAAWTV